MQLHASYSSSESVKDRTLILLLAVLVMIKQNLEY